MVMGSDICEKLEKLIELVILSEQEGISSVYVESISTYDDKKVCSVHSDVGEDWDHRKNEYLRTDTISIFKMLNPSSNEGIGVDIR